MYFHKKLAGFAVILLLGSCLAGCSSNPSNGIAGMWKATFSDSTRNPVQVLKFSHSGGELKLMIDEPGEDWYDIPGEKLYFNKDSLYFERFWGLERYTGRYNQAGNVISGFKLLRNRPAIPFTMKRVPPESLQKQEPAPEYHYQQPKLNDPLLPTASLSEAGMDSLPLIRLVNGILPGDIPNIHSLLIWKENRLVLEEYFHGYSASRPHRIHSVTKSFTSALAGIAIDHHLISGLEAPVWPYFSRSDSLKWVKNHYDIRVEHLLSMSAGLDWKGLTLNETNDDMDMYASGDPLGYLLDKDLPFQPGTHFCYNNGLSLMLGRMIEEASGMTVSDFARENLFNDLGITGFRWEVDDNGLTLTDGGLKITPRDMLRFGLLYLNGGLWNGRQLLPAEWIRQSTQARFHLGDRGYALHWWTMDYDVGGKQLRSFYALGHGEQAIIVVPELQLVVVMTAGNYMQQEHRPFEIMKEFILPSSIKR